MKLGTFELNKTHCLDNVAGLRQLPDACIDLTVTSPPYDNLRTYEGFTWDFESLAQELYRVTKPGGVVVWVVGDATINGSETGSSFRQALYFMQCGFNLHDTMIYHADKPPINADRYQSSFEYMFILSSGSPKTFNPLMVEISGATKARRQFKHTAPFQRNSDGSWNVKDRNSKTKERIRDNIWHFWAGFSANDKLSAGHPAVFPEALARDHILSWSSPGDIVLDPFSGSGTTGKMAKQNGRLFLGFELSQKYTDLANKRMAAAQPPLFVDVPTTTPAPIAEQVALFG